MVLIALSFLKVPNQMRACHEAMAGIVLFGLLSSVTKEKL
jgi:hypothetical protein